MRLFASSDLVDRNCAPPTRSFTPPIRRNSSLLKPTVSTARKSMTPTSSLDLGSQEGLPDYLRRYLSPGRAGEEKAPKGEQRKIWKQPNTYRPPEKPQASSASVSSSVELAVREPTNEEEREFVQLHALDHATQTSEGLGDLESVVTSTTTTTTTSQSRRCASED